MRDSDWLKLNLRLIFLICVQTQILCNGALVTIPFSFNHEEYNVVSHLVNLKISRIYAYRPIQFQECEECEVRHT